jgi:tRNA(fMet)-specific endonuclease VapC
VTVYPLDTAIFSLMVKQNLIIRARVALLPAVDHVVICTVVRGEVLYGLERMPRGKKHRGLETKIVELFASILCEPIPQNAADQYARIKREAERKGTPLDENDLWIAATALSLGAILVTSDSDFQRVSRLSIEDWA